MEEEEVNANELKKNKRKRQKELKILRYTNYQHTGTDCYFFHTTINQIESRKSKLLRKEEKTK